LHGKLLNRPIVNKKRTNRQNPSLYWVYTYDHYEDWFVVARSSREARQSHENDCGYNLGDARAKVICRFSKIPATQLPGYARYRDLSRCGVKTIHKDYPSLFEKDGVRFKEGAIGEDIYTAATDKIAGLSVLRMRDTDYFKIGVTTHLRKRISSLITANPVRFAVTCFVEVKHPLQLESILHRKFQKNRQEGEWFWLRTQDLKRLYTILQREIKAQSGRFHLNRFPFTDI
jgi:hypothetical protein